MMEYVDVVSQVGFPISVAVILLYDKLKTNGSLKKVVEDNTEILKRKMERDMELILVLKDNNRILKKVEDKL